MFKNRAIQVSLTKPDGSAGTSAAVDRDAVLYYNTVIIANAERAAKGFVAVYAAVKVINTACEVLLKITPTR